MGIFSKPEPVISQISTPLVRAFSVMLANPHSWLSVQDVMDRSGASKATIYQRFGDLVKARVLSMKQVGQFRHFMLKSGWEDTRLGAALWRRCVALGARNGSISGPDQASF